MTIYGQNLGGFERKNSESICNGDKTKLHKTKIVYMWCFDAYFVTSTSL